jgi:DNA-binding transcriptional LysR family regulator
VVRAYNRFSEARRAHLVRVAVVLGAAGFREGLTVPEDVQLPYLDTFSKAAELSSFTAAAGALGLTQAAVSQRIHALEAALGKPLFQRQGGRVVLTAVGHKLYHYAERILELHREARREVSGYEPPAEGELLLAASSVPGEHFLPGLLAGFHERFPSIQVRATVSDSMTVLDQVEHDKAQLGLVGRTADRPHLEFAFLARDRMVLVVPPNHALAGRRRVGLKELMRHPFLLRELGSGLRHGFEKALERAGYAPAALQVAVELGSNEAIKEAVQRGLGVAVLSTYVVHKELAAGRLHAVAVKDFDCDRDIFLVHDRRRVLPPPARRFRTYLQHTPLPLPNLR